MLRFLVVIIYVAVCILRHVTIGVDVTSFGAFFVVDYVAFIADVGTANADVVTELVLYCFGAVVIVYVYMVVVLTIAV